MDYSYKNKLARQINGPIAQSLMKADHAQYVSNDRAEWFEHRRLLSLDNATTDELNQIGKFLGIPRPYCTTGAHVAALDIEYTPRGNVANVDAGTVQETTSGVVWKLQDFIYNANTETLSPAQGEEVSRYADDETYRLYIQNMAGLRRSHSLMALADMLYTFNETGTFELEFQDNGDILIFLDEQYAEYEPFLQVALDLVFNALPRLGPIKMVEYNMLVVDHAVRTMYANLVDPDWLLWIDHEVGFISCKDKDKIWVQDDGIIEGTVQPWIYDGQGIHDNCLYMKIGE